MRAKGDTKNRAERAIPFLYRVIIGGLLFLIALFLVLTLRIPSVGGALNAEKQASASGAVVPKFTGLMEADAEEKALALQIGTKTVLGKPSNEPYGTVIAQSPKEGTSVPWHSTISLTVSTGPATVAAPDVSGLIYHDAASAFQDRGFSDISIRRKPSSAPMGTVIDTHPKAFARAATDTKVVLAVSIGPDADADTAPGNYLGLSKKNAQTESAKAGLFLLKKFKEGYSDLYGAGMVMAQSIDPRMPVKAGSEIDMTVSLGGSGKIPAAVTFTEVKTVTLTKGDTYQGGAYAVELTQTGPDGTLYQRTAASGPKAMKFPCTLKISGLTGAESGTLCLYESDGKGGWLPRTSWPVTFPAKAS